jgi:pimeloyl-ACP methyl ester carboxylesterase
MAFSKHDNNNGRSAAEPVRFAQCAGMFTAADPGSLPADCAVLLISPWGFEDLCLRKFYREIAEALASKGLPNLRFDLPGTGDAADLPQESSLELWLTDIKAAADELKRYSGASNVILAGHGLGATLALMAANRIETTAGLALLAPVVSGRTYLRETALWWKLIAADLGLGPEFTESGNVTIAGFHMPKIVESDIRTIKEAALRLTRPLPVLTINRTARDSDQTLADALETAGSTVTRLPYDGYDALVANPIRSKSPASIVEALAAWARQITPQTERRAQPIQTLDATLIGPGFRETGIRFGPNNGLAGTICEPQSARRGASVLIVGTSYDRASGWGGMGTRTARDLARCGIASLRFDAAGVADSPPVPGDPKQILYAPSLDRDVRQALAALTTRDPGPAIIAGRCSGGYHAFQAALADPACQGIALINPFAFIWDPDKDVDEALLDVARPLTDYSQRALNPETFRRILRGEVDLRTASLNIAKQLCARIAAKMSPHLGSLSHRNQLKTQIKAAFKQLDERNKQVLLLYGDKDVGLEQVTLTFGPEASALKRMKNVTFLKLGDIDHNITGANAQAEVIGEIGKLALRYK